MLAAGSADALAPSMPSHLLGQLASSWQAAHRRGRTQIFEHDFAGLCERYNDSDTPQRSKPESTHKSIVSEAERQCGSAHSNVHIHDLPDDLLARVLCRTLDPEHPGSLCTSAYIRDLQSNAALRTDRAFSKVSRLSEHFSRNALLKQKRSGQLRSILVCKRWHHVVMHGNVVRVMAVEIPCGLPASVRTLMLRLEDLGDVEGPPSCGRLDKYQFDVLERMQECLQGLQHLEELVCCCPRPPVGYSCESGRRLGRVFVSLARCLPASLKALDISHCMACEGVLPSIEACLSAASCLTSLRLRLRVEPDSFQQARQALAPRISALSKLAHLLISGDWASPTELNSIGLKMSPLLRSLSDAGPVHYGVRDARSLASFVTDLPDLRVLDLHKSFFECSQGDLEAELLRPILALTALHTLKLLLCDVTPKGGAACFGPLSSMPTMRHLHLQWWQSGYNTTLHFDSQLTSTVPLESLALSGSAVCAFQNIPVHRMSLFTALTSLSLGKDSLASELDLGGRLPALAGLRELILSGLYLNNDALAELADASCLFSLRSLDISNTCLSDDEACYLRDLLTPLTRLEVLDLSHNSLSEAGVQAVAPALEGMHCLQDLQLRGNHLSGSGQAYVLAPLLHNWPCLRCLGVDCRDRACEDDAEEEGGACDLGFMWLAAHMTDAKRVSALDNAVDFGLERKWEKLHAIWTGPRL